MKLSFHMSMEDQGRIIHIIAFLVESMKLEKEVLIGDVQFNLMVMLII